MDAPEVTFVNGLAAYGVVNGVMNVAFVTFAHIPDIDSITGHTNGVVEARPFISANLRMDLACVQQLRDACDKALAENTKPAVN